MSEENNSAKGRDSFDIKIGDLIVPFFNSNVSDYPTEAGGPRFILVPVTKQTPSVCSTQCTKGDKYFLKNIELLNFLLIVINLPVVTTS
jgi:hypothetical protein